MIGEFDVALSDVLEKFLLVTVVKDKWRCASEHFINYASDAPPVNSESVPLSVDNLRSQVFGCATEGFRVRIRLDILLRQTEIGQLSIAVFIDQNVLWL